MGIGGCRWTRVARLGAALTIFSCTTNARAGAWAKPPGETEAIASFSAKTYDGNPEQELDLYIEHGLKRNWTMVGGLRAWARGDDQNTFAQLGMRRQLKAMGAAAAEVRLISGRDWNNCGGWGLETRALAGKQIELNGQNGFTDLEIAARTFSDGCQELRIEGSAGAIPERGLGMLFQINAEKLIGAPIENGLDLRVQGQVSAVYALSSELKVQIGARVGLENASYREQALIVGLWRSF